jgi:hypothetical protein
MVTFWHAVAVAATVVGAILLVLFFIGPRE